MTRVRDLRRARQKRHYSRKKEDTAQLAARLDAVSTELSALRQEAAQETLLGSLLEKMNSYASHMMDAIFRRSVRHTAAATVAPEIAALKRLHFESVDGQRSGEEARLLHAAAMHLFSETAEPSYATVR
jgi:hypothetical protein